MSAMLQSNSFHQTQPESRFPLNGDASANLKATKKSIMGLVRGAVTPPRSRTKELDLNLLNQKVAQQTSGRQAQRDSSAKVRSRENPVPQQSRSMLNRFASKIRPPPIANANAFCPAVSASAKEMRDQALRERGLLPPLTRPDLSQQEYDRDSRLSISANTEPKSPTDDEPSAASVIKREWEAKNRATMQTFRFGGDASTQSLLLVEPGKETFVVTRVQSPELVSMTSGRAPTRALPDTPPAAVHVQAPSVTDDEPAFDPYGIPLPLSPCPTGNESIRAPSVKSPSIKSTKSISKSLRSLARSIKSTKSRKTTQEHDIPSSPTLLFPLNFSPSAPSHSFPNHGSEPELTSTTTESNIPEVTTAAFNADDTIADSTADTNADFADEVSLSASLVSPVTAEFWTPPTSPREIETVKPPHLVPLPSSPRLAPVESSRSPPEYVWAPRNARAPVQSIASTTARSRSRSTIASSVPLPSLSETGSVVSDNESEPEYKYVPKQYESTPLRIATSVDRMPKDATARLTGLNINVSHANVGMTPVIVENPVEESWWPVIVNDVLPEENAKAVTSNLTTLVIAEEPESDAVADLFIPKVSVKKTANEPAKKTVSEPAEEAVEEPKSAARVGRRKSMAAFSSSFSSLRRSVVGTLSSKSAVSSRSAPTARSKSLLKATSGFDASRLPASPTAPSFVSSNTNRSSASYNSGNRTVGSGARRGVAPTMHSRGSILVETNEIEDEESRRMTEMAFLY